MATTAAGPFAAVIREGTVYITFHGSITAKFVAPLGNSFANAWYLVTCANVGLAAREATDTITKVEDAQLAKSEVF